MPAPLLIIISGPPCSGKTALGGWLAQQLTIPLFHRDAFKEVLFDSLGWSDLEWSQKLGGASYSLLYHTIEALLRAEGSMIVESNFDPQFDTQRLRDLAGRYPFLPLQIRCMAEGAVLSRALQAARRERPAPPWAPRSPEHQRLCADRAGGRRCAQRLPRSRRRAHRCRDHRLRGDRLSAAACVGPGGDSAAPRVVLSVEF